MEKVTIEPGSVTGVVVLVPWAETIHDIRLSIDMDLPAEIKTLAIQDLTGVDEVFRQSLQGLPVDATDWSNGVLKHSLNEYMAVNLQNSERILSLNQDRSPGLKWWYTPRGR